MENQPVSKTKTLFSDLGLFYAAMIWGATFFLVKGALNGVDPVMLVSYRFILAGTLLLIYLILTKRDIFANWKEAVKLAVILWCLYVPQTIGLKYTTASNSGFITGLFVAFVPIFLRLIFKKRPTLWEVVASIISLIGLWILTGGMKQVNIGDIITLTAAMTYALHLLYTDKYMKKGCDPFILSMQQFLLIGIFSLIVGIVFKLPLQVTGSSTYITIIFLALFPTLSAFVIQAAAQRFTSPLKVSLIFAFEPVFAGIFAWTLGGEQFVVHGAVGGGLIAIALALSGIPTKKAKQEKLI